MRPSLYEFAGGEPALRALVTAHHARCLADPELNHPFSHGGHPQHLERLAAYLGEAWGGPPRFTELGVDHSAVLHMHAGNGDMGDLGERFHACFMAALDDADLPSDAEFRAAMSAYMTWAVSQIETYTDDATVPDGVAVPRWSWDGPQASTS